MTQYQFARYQSFEPLLRSGTLPLSVAAKMLNISTRQLRRYQSGDSGVVRRTPWNRLSEEIRDYMLATKQESAELNCQWISELASDRFGASVSRPSVWRILRQAGLRGIPRMSVDLRLVPNLTTGVTEIRFWNNHTFLGTQRIKNDQLKGVQF